MKNVSPQSGFTMVFCDEHKVVMKTVVFKFNSQGQMRHNRRCVPIVNFLPLILPWK